MVGRRAFLGSLVAVVLGRRWVPQEPPRTMTLRLLSSTRIDPVVTRMFFERPDVIADIQAMVTDARG